MKYIVVILMLLIFIMLIYFFNIKNRTLINIIQKDPSNNQKENYEKLKVIIQQYEKKLFAYLVFNELESLDVKVSIKKNIQNKVGMVPLFPLFDAFVSKTDPGINNLNNLVSTWLTENGFSSNDPINDLEKLLTQKIRQDAKLYVVDAIKSME